jgi:hypothetical protein
MFQPCWLKVMNTSGGQRYDRHRASIQTRNGTCKITVKLMYFSRYFENEPYHDYGHYTILRWERRGVGEGKNPCFNRDGWRSRISVVFKSLSHALRVRSITDSEAIS